MLGYNIIILKINLFIGPILKILIKRTHVEIYTQFCVERIEIYNLI